MRSVVLALCVVKAAAFGGTQYLSGAGGASEYAAGPHSQATQPGQNYNVGFQTQKCAGATPPPAGQRGRGGAWIRHCCVVARAGGVRRSTAINPSSVRTSHPPSYA